MALLPIKALCSTISVVVSLLFRFHNCSYKNNWLSLAEKSKLLKFWAEKPQSLSIVEYSSHRTQNCRHQRLGNWIKILNVKIYWNSVKKCFWIPSVQNVLFVYKSVFPVELLGKFYCFGDAETNTINSFWIESNIIVGIDNPNFSL